VRPRAAALAACALFSVGFRKGGVGWGWGDAVVVAAACGLRMAVAWAAATQREEEERAGCGESCEDDPTTVVGAIGNAPISSLCA
jgi:hypothetical protein